MRARNRTGQRDRGRVVVCDDRTGGQSDWPTKFEVVGAGQVEAAANSSCLNCDRIRNGVRTAQIRIGANVWNGRRSLAVRRDNERSGAERAFVTQNERPLLICDAATDGVSTIEDNWSGTATIAAGKAASATDDAIKGQRSSARREDVEQSSSCIYYEIVCNGRRHRVANSCRANGGAGDHACAGC